MRCDVVCCVIERDPGVSRVEYMSFRLRIIQRAAHVMLLPQNIT